MPEETDRQVRERDVVRRRMRDFFVLVGGSVAILTLLTLTGAVGLVEWITGSIVMMAGSLAYYVGSLPPAARPAVPTLEKTSGPTAQQRLDVIKPLLLSLPFPALLLDSEQRIACVNDAGQASFRLNMPDGQLASRLIRQPELLEAFNRVAGSAAKEQVEVTFGDDDQTWMSYIQAGPEPGSVIAILEDRTAVRRAERARADFLANASHELRTPLTAIGGFIETMRGPAKDDKHAWDGFLSIIQEQTERMKRLVADLLSLSRIEFSEHRAPSATTDMLNIVLEAESALKPIALEAEVTIALTTDQTPIPVIGERDELTQVIQNLVSNAIKYAPKNSRIALTLGVANTMEEAAQLCARQMPEARRSILLAARASAKAPAVWLRVEDRGAGISAQHLPRLGERFYRADESRGGKIPGTGLGLAIVKHIMARHRGGLAVESIENSGTAFGVWMPTNKPANLT